jgi:hypothetical protein
MRAPCAVLVLLLAACSGTDAAWTPETGRRPVDVTEVLRLVEPSTVQLAVSSCNGDPEITSLTQGGTRVEVEVTSTVTNPGDACLDTIDVVLDEPLGDRELVDLTSGRTVPVPAT